MATERIRPSSKTLYYRPEVRAYIATVDGQQLDISNDIISGSVTRIVNGASTFGLVLNNKGINGKYNGVLSRMDRITIYLKRTRWFQVFAGYLDSVPGFDLYPTTCTITGKDTIKRLINTYWDPSLPASLPLLTQNQDLSSPDAGLGFMITNILTKVGNWPSKQIHIQNLPRQFLDNALQYLPQTNAAASMAYLDAVISKGITLGTSSTPDDPALQSSPVAGGTIGPDPAGAEGLNAFMYAERMQESGGNYTVVNGIGAAGAYQMIKSTWEFGCKLAGASTTQYPTANSAPAAIQDQVAKTLFLYYYNGQAEQSWANVACCWYHGSLIPTSEWPNIGSPSIQTYVSDVIAKMTLYVKGTPGSKVGNTQSVNPQAGSDTNNPAAQDPKVTVTVKSPIPSPQAKLVAKSIKNGKKTILQYCYNAPDDTKVVACVPGTVTSITQEPLSGKSILLEFGIGQHFIYNKLTSVAITKGSTVTQGQILGTVGGPKNKNNYAFGFQVKDNGVLIDPGEYIGSKLTNTITPPVGSPTAETGQSDSLFNILYLTPVYSDLANSLSGIQSLEADEQLITTIEGLVTAGLRQYQSAPNGDFIAFYPDYFGFGGSEAKFRIEDIEMQNVSIQVNDDALTTHVFAVGDTLQQGSINIPDIVASKGIVNIQQPFVIDQLLQIKQFLPDLQVQDFGNEILQRYGVRPLKVEFPAIKSNELEFFLAIQTFMQKWTQQFSTQVQFTFLPELWPSMRVQLADHGVIVYIEAVTHTFSFDQGFTTQASISCPTSVTNGSLPTSIIPPGALR